MVERKAYEIMGWDGKPVCPWAGIAIVEVVINSVAEDLLEVSLIREHRFLRMGVCERARDSYSARNIGRPYRRYADKIREYDVGVKDLLVTEGGIDKIWEELDLPPRNLEKARLKRELAQLEKLSSSPGEELRLPQTIDNNLKEDEIRSGEKVAVHDEAKSEAVEEVAQVDAHSKSDLAEIDRLILEAAKIEATPLPTKQNVLEESYHVFIGYRVATEEIFTTALYDKLIMTSGVDNILMPPNNAIVKPYLDKKVLKDGEPWADGFGGLANSRVFAQL